MKLLRKLKCRLLGHKWKRGFCYFFDKEIKGKRRMCKGQYYWCDCGGSKTVIKFK